ncbi:MAG: Bax inhibitor-1 family protein [Helicobacteraceae bacterium]|nr:Bax inhibitor-1 family protein [Helicobacteraceae bacterium]
MFCWLFNLNGVTMSIIFLVYAESSIAFVFFITAGTFAAMGIYALTIKRDLYRYGKFAALFLRFLTWIVL